MVILLSLFVVAAIALYFAFLYVRKNNTEKIAALNQALQNLSKTEVIAQFPKLKRLNLTGSSFEQYEALIKEYKKITNDTLPRLAEALNEVVDANEHYRFMLVKGQLDDVAAKYEHAKAKLAELNISAQKILRQVDDCQKNFEKIKGGFEEIRKTLLAKSFMFELAAEKLDANLQQLSDQLNHAQEVMAKADYTKAKQELSHADTMLADLKHAVNVIPDLIHQYKNVFFAQLNEIASSYSQLVNEGIGFSDDVAGQLGAAKQEYNNLKAAIKTADVTAAQASQSNLTSRIDGLYDVLEKEYRAKAKVAKQQNVLKKFIAHAKERQHVLEVQLDQLNQSYVFHEDELSQSKQLAQTLQKITQECEQTASHLAKVNRRNAELKADDKQVATINYSGLVEAQQKQLSLLQQIEQKQSKLKEQSERLCELERTTKNSLTDYEETLSKLKRQIDDALLNGLPNDYIELYNQVYAQIKHQKAALNHTKIDIIKIAQTSQRLGDDVTELSKRTEKLLESAWLCERLVAHANRYKNRYDDVAAAIKQSSHLFNDTYDYNAARQTIADALEQVEPGIYEKAVADYQRTLN